MASLVAPKQFSPVEDAENIKKACLGFTSSLSCLILSVQIIQQDVCVCVCARVSIQILCIVHIFQDGEPTKGL